MKGSFFLILFGATSDTCSFKNIHILQCIFFFFLLYLALLINDYDAVDLFDALINTSYIKKTSLVQFMQAQLVYLLKMATY